MLSLPACLRWVSLIALAVIITPPGLRAALGRSLRNGRGPLGARQSSRGNPTRRSRPAAPEQHPFCSRFASRRTDPALWCCTIFLADSSIFPSLVQRRDLGSAVLVAGDHLSAARRDHARTSALFPRRHRPTDTGCRRVCCRRMGEVTTHSGGICSCVHFPLPAGERATAPALRTRSVRALLVCGTVVSPACWTTCPRTARICCQLIQQRSRPRAAAPISSASSLRLLYRHEFSNWPSR